MSARLCLPTQSLLQGMPYVPSHETNLRLQWAAWFAEHAKPVTPEQYASDQAAEHNTYQARYRR